MPLLFLIYPLNLGGLFLHSRVLFHGLATNRSSRLRAISHLRVSGRSGDDTLRFATGHADRDATDQ